MSETEEPIVIALDRERVRKVSCVGIWAAGCTAIVTAALVAITTRVPLWSVVVAEFVFQWAIVIGLSAVLLATVYWEVR